MIYLLKTLVSGEFQAIVIHSAVPEFSMCSIGFPKLSMVNRDFP